jgi:hypothetical protein
VVSRCGSISLSDRELWRPRHAPPPPKAALADADVIPLAYVNQLSKLTFSVSPHPGDNR